MRWRTVSLMALALAGCSKAPDGDRPGADAAGSTVSAAAGVAFTYAYVFRLPSQRIADVQEAHARACESLGAARCRITGMRYSVDDAGTVTAGLDVKLAAVIARGFGRAQTQVVANDGGALIGAEIGGTDAQPATDEARGNATAAAAARTRIAALLARADLPPRERVALRAQQAAAEEQGRTAATALDTAQASVATTPMSFDYRAGSGIGLSAKVADAWAVAIGSLGLTIAAALTVVAALAPPALLLLVLFLLWRRVGRFGWARLRRLADPDGA